MVYSIMFFVHFSSGSFRSPSSVNDSIHQFVCCHSTIYSSSYFYPTTPVHLLIVSAMIPDE